MKYYDISVALEPGMPVWPGDPLPVIEQYATLPAGEPANCTSMRCSTHTGTHVDAPYHVFSDGSTVDQLPLDILIGPAAVVELPEADQLDRETLESIQWPELSRILFKTRNSNLWQKPRHPFDPQFISFTADGADFLLEKAVKLVGIDYLSIDRYHATSLAVHQRLLRKAVIIIESLNLVEVSPGNYELYCLPLKIIGSDGAPARVVLKKI